MVLGLKITKMAFLYALYQQRQTVNRLRPSLIDMSDDEIRQITRFSRDAVDDLCVLLYDAVDRQTRRSNALTVENQVLCALQFFSSGSFQWMVGRSCALSQPSACRAVSIVTETLCAKANDFFRFPTNVQHQTSRLHLPSV